METTNQHCNAYNTNQASIQTEAVTENPLESSNIHPLASTEITKTLLNLIKNKESDQYYQNIAFHLRHSDRIRSRKKNFSENCYYILENIIAFGEPNREQVASFFYMSISTLQRRLRKEGTTFKDILIDVRQNLARHYLMNEPQLSCTDISLLLGYKDPSQFFKTFKSWYGVTPMEYRKNYEAAEDAARHAPLAQQAC